MTGKLKFIMLGAFALKDPLRPTVKSAVQHAYPHMNIRLVSGDHIETATAVARKAGILEQDHSSS